MWLLFTMRLHSLTTKNRCIINLLHKNITEGQRCFCRVAHNIVLNRRILEVISNSIVKTEYG